MPRVTTPLTDTQIKNAKPKEKEYNLVHGKGLSLRIKPNGSKLWLFNYYRPHTKKRANLSLGPYPELSLANAGKLRDEYRELLVQDIDPQEYRNNQALEKKEANQNTFKAVAEQWLKVKRTKVSSRHADKVWQSLKLHIFPDMGKIPIHKVKAKDTIRIIRPIEKKGVVLKQSAAFAEESMK